MKLQEVTKLGQFTIEILVNSVETLLELLLRKLAYGVVRGIVVHVREKDGLRERGLDVFARTTITVPTGSNLIDVLVVRHEMRKR